MECPYCKKTLANKESLRTHQRDNATCLKLRGKKPNKRNVCRQEGCPCGGKGFAAKSSLEAHINDFLGLKPYTCPYEDCGKTFGAKYLFDRHVKGKHSDEEKPFKCEICGKGYSWSPGLSAHRRKEHKGVSMLCCPFEDCDYEAYTKDEIDKHLTSSKHYDIKAFTCDICCESFYQSSQLNDHVRRVHDKIKRFECDACAKSFYSKQELRDHKRTHSEVRAFACDHPGCEEAFKTSRSLRFHRDNVHRNIRPYICYVCGDALQRSSALRDHMLTHTNEQPFTCNYPMCGQGFTRKQNMQRHYKRYHTAEGQAKRKKQETLVAKLLKKHGIAFKREHHVSFSCFSEESVSKFARIDFVIHSKGCIIFLEVDENCHRFGYDPACDMKRMTYILQGLTLGGNSLPVVFLRYNPNGYKVDGVTRRTKKKTREKELIRWLEKFEPNPDTPLRIMYMYYDSVTVGDELVPQVTLDPTYNKHLRACVEPSCIVAPKLKTG